MTRDSTKNQIVIIGAGLAGLVTAIMLKKSGLDVILIEKKQFPFHRVCGEYISNEVKPFLLSLGIMPEELNPSSISEFELTSIAGKSKTIQLDLGGFGISRYAFDQYLYQIALDKGVNVIHDQVEDIFFSGKEFCVKTKEMSIRSELVIGAFGKRSVLDKKLTRSFMLRPSPYVGVKYHIKYDYPTNKVSLHNFAGGYCGLSAIEGGKYNLCYLSHRSNLKEYRNIEKMEQDILCQNPKLKDVFDNADFLFDAPQVINEISFETKQPVENHILMCGDAAGMITPLCGNGMAMAIHSAKIVSEEVINYFTNHKDRGTLEMNYSKRWNHHFRTRLAVGRTIQKLFGATFQSNFALSLLNFKPLANFIVKNTHGQPF
ncbi:NAD(P)/FAD-dependent oxidoreductase [Fulvivirga lutea]|uniref:NAD(P)/FAD-dependent oxidoreductase n=1 Tax=Fulvivirga lutea TaxID=2810512 RepID=A0A975A1T1_9BACT|nr:NAD(P)/FAD-dependent oxidoreductase [Fulvivirga lutea]QSE98156.1 NAD(P)/FAD-dependent oxidoreductase [Fulvivirga lutea]